MQVVKTKGQVGSDGRLRLGARALGTGDCEEFETCHADPAVAGEASLQLFVHV